MQVVARHHCSLQQLWESVANEQVPHAPLYVSVLHVPVPPPWAAPSYTCVLIHPEMGGPIHVLVYPFRLLPRPLDLPVGCANEKWTSHFQELSWMKILRDPRFPIAHEGANLQQFWPSPLAVHPGSLYK